MPDEESRSSLELLYNVSRELASALDLRTVLQRVLFQSLKSVGGERGSIIVLDDKGKAIDAAIVYRGRVHDHTTQQLRETMERGLAGWVARQSQPAWIQDTSRDSRWLRRPDDASDRSGAKSAMCVPLLARERLVGVLTLVHPTPGAYTKDHFDLMQIIADQAGIAVLNARLYAESQRQARVMTALAESAATISASLRLEDVLQRILNETIEVLGVETVALALVESSGELVFRAATGKNSRGIVGKSIHADQGITGLVAKKGEGLIIPVVGQDNRFLPEVEQFTEIDVRSLACAPIFAQGRVIGVLEAINPTSEIFDPDALLVLAGIGNLAGSAIQHAQLFERLQAAHKRYRELFDDSIDPILITDWNGKILEANRQAAVLIGYTSEQLSRKQIIEIHQVNHNEMGKGFEKLKASKACTYESVLMSKSGQEIPIQVYVRKVVFEDSESLQWIMRDISERKDLDLLREDLTAMIYHDLRSPLANVVSSLDMLSAIYLEPENENAKSVLSIAQRSTARIQRLISSLLDISRLESGQPVGEQQSVSPHILAQDAVDTVRPTADSRRQNLTINLPEKLPLVLVDIDMIRRVLINLLENAIKFTSPEGKIEIGAKANGQWLQMWVLDNGPGIPLLDQGKIFEKFTRLRGEETSSGLGVGLAFCRLAIQGHGGKIWVDSRPGHGAKFSITLPVSKGETLSSV